ncbi:hypothetical protein KR215_002259 [Drosophila sulfurigaster]|nr:hypothetical protein KR215_002259 [Drosophila sulfurigaster]
MTTRICVYRDCHNFYSRVDNSACSDVTLFSFPKDTKRAELWRLLGQVHPKIGAKQLYMCSKHFDSKYLSVTKHRTTLIGEALPIAYENTEEVDDPNESAEISLSHENLYIKSNENGNIEICSPKKATKTAQSFYIELDDDQLTLDNVVLLESTEQLKQTPPSPLDDDDQQLLDASEVQTIIVKGKHYVQMPREYYVQEKRQMLQQLQQYKEILSNIRQQLKPLDDL